MYKNYFSFPGSLEKTFKDSYKLLIMSCVLCSDDFFIKRLISKKKERKKVSLRSTSCQFFIQKFHALHSIDSA